ncbi:MAG: hypothetical protein ACYDAN_06140 [Candidatus Limnocylindrales bacterium]
MSLYLRVRAGRAVALVAAAVVLLLAWPGSSAAATPSPAGATVMAGVFLAIAVPSAVGWACSRGDERLEATGVRAIRLADLVFACASCVLVACAGAGLHAAGLADSGLAAARATLVYLGLMLLAVPYRGWRLAPVLPALFLLAVAVFGRGEDIDHPARWAFIAAQGDDVASWALTAGILVVGVGAYLGLQRRAGVSVQE